MSAVTNSSEQSLSVASANCTYDDLEDEVARHQAKLDARALRHALEARKETEEDREQHHEHRKQRGGQDTGDDADHDVGERAQPREPLVRRAQRVDVRHDTDERNCEAM